MPAMLIRSGIQPPVVSLGSVTFAAPAFCRRKDDHLCLGSSMKRPELPRPAMSSRSFDCSLRLEETSIVVRSIYDSVVKA